jgi:hypothetical protein
MWCEPTPIIIIQAPRVGKAHWQVPHSSPIERQYMWKGNTRSALYLYSNNRAVRVSAR